MQSAMLKRSDSVNKRWSAQAPQSLSRQNSTVNNRGSAALNTYGSMSKGEPRPSSLSRDNSMEPSSRPGSSSSNMTITKDAAAGNVNTPKGEFVKPALPHHSRSKSVASTFSEDTRPQEDTSPPSPSKRWSPTKSSWLESALNKPESPKPKQPPPQQPTWMAEINRIKQQRGSVDLGKGGSPMQTPPEGPASGRTSPIKDVQLKPVALRKTETPKKDDPFGPSPKPKPAITSPKPSIAAKDELPSLGEPTPEPVEEKKEMSTEELPEVKPKPAPLASRMSKDSPLASPAAKPKPDTPPKKDFRAGLRSRQGTSDSSKKEEVSELQNVFGRLKKTETKNYVAPDTFKDNILRGKSGLTVTGGPKPSVRRDEFKESIISKKTAMLAKAQEHGSAAHKKTDSSSQPTPTPEAIAKRKLLGRSDSISKDVPPKEPSAPPEALARQQSLRSSKPVLPEKLGQSSSAFVPKETIKSSKLADRFNPALAGILARGPPPISGSPPASAEDSSRGPTPSRPSAEEKKGPAPELTHMTKGRARGPKRRAPASKQAPATKEAAPSKAPVAAVPLVKTEDVLPSTRVAQADEPSEEQPMAKTPARDSLKAKPSTPVKSPDLSKRLSKAPSPELARKPEPVVIEKKTPAKPIPVPQPSPKPEVQAQNSPSPPKVAGWRSSRPLPTPPTKLEVQTEPSAAPKEVAPPNAEASPTRKDPSPDKLGFSVKSATALWGRQSASSSPAPAEKAKSLIKLPTRADEKAALHDYGLNRHQEESAVSEPPKPLTPKPKPVGLGLGSVTGFFGARSRESSPVPPTKPISARGLPVSPPASGDRPQSEPFKASPMPDKPNGLFAEFFDDQPVTTGALPDNIDTVQVLKNPPYEPNSTNKIRTLRKQIQEVTGDGKLINVPMQEEHVLFQDSMYICTHIYGDSKGARVTDVYLWSGNGVAESTLEDAQLFGRNVAKQNQGKLTILRQGNETPNFFEALGGIVITRRGSRPAGKDYMLCGRRHLGHLVFDEVDFSLKSFCSGFAYLISTSAGKVYLWKGRGCSSEELSGARLMGMDLTLSGELIEVDEGTESQDLINVFPPHDGKGPAIPRSADHWRYKATSDKYRTRLFKIEQQEGGKGWGQSLQVSSFFTGMLRRPSWNATTDRPQTPTTPKSPLPQTTTKVVEVMPYCQRDLEPEHIFVLDAFFEVYM